MKPEPSDGYIHAIEVMIAQVVLWTLIHPNAELTFRFPQDSVAIVSPISKAIKADLFWVSNDALEMFRELNWVGEENPVTLIQLRVVMDYVYGRTDKAE